MGPTIRSVCVYCASSEAVDPAYRRIAAELGGALAQEGWSLVYGGGNIGLMGEVAQAALAGGAEVTGVIPHRLAEHELAFEDVTELVLTETMRERKAVMDARSDAFVVLPGGIGTLEELVEILTLKQLGFHDRAIVVLDAHGFWDPLVAQLQRMVDERFAHAGVRDLWQVAADVPGTVQALRSYVPPPARPVAPVGREDGAVTKVGPAADREVAALEAVESRPDAGPARPSTPRVVHTRGPFPDDGVAGVR